MKTPKLSSRERNSLFKDQDAFHKNDPAYNKRANVDFYLYLATVLIIALSIRLFVFEPVRVEGPSMEPTLYTGERMFTEKLYYLVNKPERGQIIICWYPDEKDTCVKRVIGLPGETVEIRGGQIYIDGALLDESAYWNDYIQGDMGPVTVPEKNVFVIGDNRNVSMDSRAPWVGPIPYYRIVGRANRVIWPIPAIRSV